MLGLTGECRVTVTRERHRRTASRVCELVRYRWMYTEIGLSCRWWRVRESVWYRWD